MTTTATCVLSAACCHEQEIRKSRFLARAAPIQSPDQALAFLENVAHAGANHNCWAYRIGQEYRFNDDGEPGGTAGRPILQAIESQQVDRAVVVVTRWFGGIKLGAGGLARAYGSTAAECLRLAERSPIVDTLRVTFDIGYAELPLLKARAQDWNLQIEQEDFGADGVSVCADLPRVHVRQLQSLLADLSRGASVLRPLEGSRMD